SPEQADDDTPGPYRRSPKAAAGPAARAPAGAAAAARVLDRGGAGGAAGDLPALHRARAAQLLRRVGIAAGGSRGRAARPRRARRVGVTAARAAVRPHAAGAAADLHHAAGGGTASRGRRTAL